MKKRICLALALLIIFVTAAVSAASAADFRSSTWSMTMSEVKKAEGDVTWEMMEAGSRNMEYKSMIGGESCTVYFTFVNGKLDSGLIQFWGLPVNDLGLYDRLLVVLEEKYGNGTSEGWIPYFGSKINSWRSVTWDTVTTEIMLTEIKQMESGVYCGADDYMYYITISYMDITGTDKSAIEGI